MIKERAEYIISLSREAQIGLLKIETDLKQEATLAQIPDHNPGHLELLPKEVEIVRTCLYDDGKVVIRFKAKTFCPNAEDCLTYWVFNEETGQWEMPENIKRRLQRNSEIDLSELPRKITQARLK